MAKPIRVALAKISLACALLALAAPAAAVPTRGAPTCGEWLADAKLDGGPEAWRQTADHFWLLGYLSGLSVALEADIFKNADNGTLYQWMDHYCGSHIFNGLNQAADEYAREATKDSATAPAAKP